MLQLGAISSDDPDEEKRQKEFKSLLNKLTLDNYETIKDKIVNVGIVSETTLKGLIDQVRSFAYTHLLPHSPAMLSVHVSASHELLHMRLLPGG